MAILLVGGLDGGRGGGCWTVEVSECWNVGVDEARRRRITMRGESTEKWQRGPDYIHVR